MVSVNGKAVVQQSDENRNLGSFPMINTVANNDPGMKSTNFLIYNIRQLSISL